MDELGEVQRNGPGSASTRFKPGHPGRRGAARGETGPAKGSKQPPRLLRDFRRVYEQAEELDRTEGHKTLRKLMTESPKEFLSQMTALERAHLARETKAMKVLSVAAVPTEPEEQDEGAVRMGELTERLLADFKREEEAKRVRDGR
jgi:hypothetical protein